MNKFELATTLLWVATPLAVILIVVGASQLIAGNKLYGFVIALTTAIAFLIVLWLCYKLTEDTPM